MNDPLIEAIRLSMEERGYPPTQRELAKSCGWSLGKVNERLNRLVEEGVIVKGPGGAHYPHPRSIRIIERET